MTEQSKIKVPAKLISAEGQFPGSCQPYSHCISMTKVTRKVSGASFMRAVIPFMRILLLSPNLLPKAPPPTHWGLDLNT